MGLHTFSRHCAWTLFFLCSTAFAGPFVGSYSLVEPLFADRGKGPEEAIGSLLVCLTVRADPAESISLSISLPDSGQVLSIDSSIHAEHDGSATFKFDDDGWGNSGEGKLQWKGDAVELMIEPTGSQPDANKNVHRNYGTYLLKKVACH